MKYFIDSEFIDDGKTIDLISIGIVAEDGRELYMQSVEFDPSKASEWVKVNVIERLVKCPYFYHENDWPMHQSIGGFCHQPGCPWRSLKRIVQEVKTFFNPSDGIELWGYYSAYDHVVFCQLFGTMMDLPAGYPMLTYDMRQWLDMNGMKDVRQPDDSVHNALEDARWVAETCKRLVK